MVTNKYVDFVSDKDFLKWTAHVCTIYANLTGETDMKKLHKNVVDPFKLVFDMVNTNTNLDDWIESERIRQEDKTINNAIGEFHQGILGKIKGWKDLEKGDESKVDLMKNDGSIFIELKNKHNTMNSGSTDKVRDNLEHIVNTHPNAIAYWGIIIGSSGRSGESIWKKKGRTDNPRIKKIWGKNVYELITGDSDALKKVWEALPDAIVELQKDGLVLSGKEKQEIESEFFNSAFKS